MQKSPTSRAILPAAEVLFKKRKVSLDDITSQWEAGTVVVCSKENGHFHFIYDGAHGNSEIGATHDFHHDQTGAHMGSWVIVNELTYKKVDGQLEVTYGIPPIAAKSLKSDPNANMTTLAPFAVFK